MGEAKQRAELAKRAVVEAVGLETAGGRLQVHWDETAQATPHGQMAFFIEFLTLSGLFDRWVEDCPLKLRKPERIQPTRDPGYLAVVDPRRSLALRARDGDSC